MTWRDLARRAITGVPLIMVSVGITLLLCEGVVRLVHPQLLYRYPIGLYVNDPDVEYKLTPGFTGVFETPEYTTRVHINGQGMREDHDYGPKPPNTYRILVIGDSFTIGYSVEASETFVKQLETLLNGSGDERVHYEVINAGVPGYNTAQELTRLEQEWIALDPDLVLLAFFVGNDVHDNAVVPEVMVQDGYLTERVTPPGILPYPLRSFLATHSHLYHWLWPYQRILLSPWGAQATLRRQTLQQLALYALPERDVPQENWTATERELQRFATIARRGGTCRAAVVIIPDIAQVAPSSDVLRMISRGADYDLERPDQRIAALSQALGVPALDLLPIFRLVRPGSALYYLQDQHLTALGNRTAATAIFEFLVSERLLPPAGSAYASATYNARH